MTQTISFMNFKGGVGKTTNTAMFGYRLAKRGKKVLLVDMDPQANLTTLMDRTVKAEKRYVLSEAASGVAKVLDGFYKEIYDEDGNERELDAVRKEVVSKEMIKQEQLHAQLLKEYHGAIGLQVEHYLIDGLLAGTFKKAQTVVTDNLTVIANNLQSIEFANILEEKVSTIGKQRKERYQVHITELNRLLDGIRDDYDYILIDVPPTISIYVDSAAYASDWIMGVLQTHTRSLEGAQVLVDHFIDFREKYDLDLDFVGFICVIQNNRSQIDKKVEAMAYEEFGEEIMFKTVVKQMERLKRFDDEGILEIDMHDKAVMKVYDALVDELEERMKEVSEV